LFLIWDPEKGKQEIIKSAMQLCMPVIWRQRLGRSKFKASLGKKLVRPPFQRLSPPWWFTPVIPAILEAIGRRIEVQASSRQKIKDYLKYN
jgi:hypothetical protein